jgi:hypothetical protein
VNIVSNPTFIVRNSRDFLIFITVALFQCFEVGFIEEVLPINLSIITDY